MFGLTFVDHLRLTFGHVIYSHRAHARLAVRYAQWSRWIQAAEAVLMLATLVSSVALLARGEMVYAALAAGSAAAASAALVCRLVVDFDARAYAHRVCGAQLWGIREQYRALLSDLRDGELTADQARDRRDALIHQLQTVYEKAPPADRAAFEAARREVPAEYDAALTDEEVDRFLPPSLQAGKQSAV